jgi:hypothetical protein
LTRFTRFDPSAYLSIHPRTDEAFFDYPTGGRDHAVCLAVESVENSATSTLRNKKPRSTVCHIEIDRPIHSLPRLEFQRRFGAACDDALQFRVTSLFRRPLAKIRQSVLERCQFETTKRVRYYVTLATYVFHFLKKLRQKGNVS